jgi:hypothetical protein
MTTAAAGHAAAFPAGADRGVRVPAASDVVGALRVLELAGAPSLVDVRAQYHRLARLHHPRTRSARADEARAAGAALDDLTEALELLERHHLPLDAPPR